MTKDKRAHPQDDELLLYIDGELESAAAESTRSHLDACWTCRMRASNIQATILEYARERGRSLIPGPPSNWRDLGSDFQRIHDSVRSPSLLRRITLGVFVRRGRVALIAVTATGLAAVGWFTFSRESKSDISAMIGPVPAAPAIDPPAPTLPVAPSPVHTSHVPQKTSTVHEEVAVVAELHRLRADLGEPIELERSTDNRLVLTAAGLGHDREQEIKQVLRKFPNLDLEFSEARSVASTGADKTMTQSARRPIAFERALVQYAGGRESFQNLANNVLDASDQIAMYAHALQRIDRRFAGTKLGMDSADRDVLAQVQEDYRNGARKAAQSLRNLIEPLFELLNIDSEPASNADLVEVAVELDRLTNAAFAGAQSNLADRDLYSELRGCLRRV